MEAGATSVSITYGPLPTTTQMLPTRKKKKVVVKVNRKTRQAMGRKED